MSRIRVVSAIAVAVLVLAAAWSLGATAIRRPALEMGEAIVVSTGGVPPTTAWPTVSSPVPSSAAPSPTPPSPRTQPPAPTPSSPRATAAGTGAVPVTPPSALNAGDDDDDGDDADDDDDLDDDD